MERGGADSDVSTALVRAQHFKSYLKEAPMKRRILAALATAGTVLISLVVTEGSAYATHATPAICRPSSPLSPLLPQGFGSACLQLTAWMGHFPGDIDWPRPPEPER
jgi:hypothetical protein